MANQQTIDTTWDKSQKVRGKNPDLYRKDAYGNMMYYPSYGKTSNMGWELDHKNPLANGGTDSIRNLQAMQWDENRKKGATYPYKKKSS